MAWRSESTLLGLIEQYTSQIAKLTDRAAKNGSGDLDEELVSVTVEIQDLQNELDFVRQKGWGSDEAASFVGAPRKPLPRPSSARVAFPESPDA